MRVGRISFGLGLVLLLGSAAYTYRPQGNPAQRVVTGKFISAPEDQTEVGSEPINLVQSPDGRFIVATNVGFREQLSVLDAKTGKLVSRKEFLARGRQNKGLYYGLAFRQDGARTILYASQGAEDLVGVYELSEDGTLKELPKLADKAPAGAGIPHHVTGLALSADGQTLYAVNNQSNDKNGFSGSVSLIDVTGAKPNRDIKLGAFPYDVAAITKGDNAGKRLFVSCERDGLVQAVDTETGKVEDIRAGGGTTSLLLNREQTRLYATNSLGDTLTVIDTASNKVLETILLRQGDLRGLPGASPLGMAFGADESKLFVALADMNAVAVVDLANHRVDGLIEAGWYPTSVCVSADGQRLFVANAKGVQVRNPNDVKVKNWDQYAPNILEGTVSMQPIDALLKDLPNSTKRVLTNNLSSDHIADNLAKNFRHPAIKHVIYVIKENRTYDQVFGDIPNGNGDEKICLFPKAVTPNQHALAQRFELLDNFYVCAEVSEDGWVWSTSGMANAYVERNVPYNYSRRGRSYDTEGGNNGTPVDLRGLRDMSSIPNGTLWDQAAKKNISYRDYGFFVSGGKEEKKASGLKEDDDEEAPTQKVLLGHTCFDFKQFDLTYPDSEAYKKLGLKPWPSQTTSFGAHKDSSRMGTFRREFEEFEKNGNLPGLVLMRLPRNHTAGTSEGESTPRACVADNDYAVGELVDMVSHSRFWKDTMICVLEDDAQAGFDHIDCHRSPALVISPYVERGKVDSRFYNTDSMLRTMEIALGIPAHNQYIAAASPIDVFTREEKNAEPYDAILPDKDIVGGFNRGDAYRSEDSRKLISLYRENSAPDVELNDILWGSMKGAIAPRPKLKGAKWRSADLD